MPTCDLCQRKGDDEVVETCDFCDKCLCDPCQEKEYITYRFCDECGLKWCYFDGLYADYPCQEKPGGGCLCDS